MSEAKVLYEQEGDFLSKKPIQKAKKFQFGINWATAIGATKLFRSTKKYKTLT